MTLLLPIFSLFNVLYEFLYNTIMVPQPFITARKMTKFGLLCVSNLHTGAWIAVLLVVPFKGSRTFNDLHTYDIDREGLLIKFFSHSYDVVPTLKQRCVRTQGSRATLLGQPFNCYNENVSLDLGYSMASQRSTNLLISFLRQLKG